MTYLLGIIIGLGALAYSINHLQQTLGHYFDAVGFAMVIGGTLAVTVITLPWRFYRDIIDGIKMIFVNAPKSNEVMLETCVDFMRNPSSSQTAHNRINQLAADVLKDGHEMITLGLPKEKIEEILIQRIDQHYDRLARVANSLRSLAKYPPAFGLIGTVVGLINIMRSVAAGGDPKQTGLMMSIALVATLYGLLISNLIINPAGETIIKAANYDRKAAEIALYAVMLLAERASLLEAQEILNSFVHPRERRSFIGGGIAAAAAKAPPKKPETPPAGEKPAEGRA